MPGLETELIRTALPNYTTERYYLLSELEQRVSFSHVFDGDGACESESACESELYYALWDVSDGLDVLKDGLKKLVSSSKNIIRGKTKQSNGNGESTIWNDVKRTLSIEVLISKTLQDSFENTTDTDTDENEQEQHIVRQAYKWIRDSLGDKVSYVVFGFSDKVSGTPALEAALDCVMHVGSESQSSSRPKYVVRTLTTECCLGHDSKREPDAETNVRQALFTSQEHVRKYEVGKKQYETMKQGWTETVVVALVGLVSAYWYFKSK